MERCKTCGADYGLHRYDNHQCPRNGIEETRPGYRQQWADTVYLEDSSDMRETIASLSRRVAILAHHIKELEDEICKLKRQGRRERGLPSSIQEALNSGDGSYHP